MMRILVPTLASLLLAHSAAAQGTVLPPPKSCWYTSNGAPLSGGKLTTYLAGTSTLTSTYSDQALTTPNTNPVVLNGSGCATIFLAPGTFKFVLTTSADVQVWSVDGVSSMAPFNVDVDVAGTAGETLAAGDVVYLADGTGGSTAGRWHKADADAIGTSITANQIGIARAAIATGAEGSIRIQGRMTGLSGLSAGAPYFVSATAGALTGTAPANRRFVGIADSSTTLVIASAQLQMSNPTLGATLLPAADNTYNLGSAAASWGSAWFDGTATIATASVTGTATINNLNVSANTGLSVRDSGGDHYYTLRPNTDATANRTIALTLPDAATTIALDDWFNQSVKTTATPTLAGLTVSGTGASALDVGGGLNIGTGNVALIGTDGRLNGPLSSTNIDDLSAANLTSIPAANLLISGQTTGDLLYASSSTVWARLADVATGSVLISGGVGVAPAWSTTPTFVGTNVTGILEANITDGTVFPRLADSSWTVNTYPIAFSGSGLGFGTSAPSSAAYPLHWDAGTAIGQLYGDNSGVGIGHKSTGNVLDTSGGAGLYFLAAEGRGYIAGSNLWQWSATAFTLSSSLSLAVNATGAGAIDVAGGAQFGSGNVALVGTDGKINGPLSSTNIDDLSGANLTGLVEANITDGSLLARYAETFAFTAFGAYTITATGTGGHSLTIQNLSAGTGNSASLLLGNDASATAGQWIHTSTTYTAAGSVPQDGMLLASERAGGISINAANAAGDIRLYSANTLRTTLDDAGNITHTGRYNSATLQPGFLAYNSATDSAVANGATVDFDTERYDEAGNFAADTFTAPVTGRYHFCVGVRIDDTAATGWTVTLRTSNFTYEWLSASTEDATVGGCVTVDMDSSDTAHVTFDTGGTPDILGSGIGAVTFFSGRLVL